ncbi:MAG: lipoprotein-releasing ABC transporter permease subunit, partial [Alphaproteobacteria bacterium]|nr:lipoprotein-releasing ABC transporter permease subunit [Alphaproteobacteria bacterium]
MPFSAFERMLAFRYLRARRQEGFISVIAAFSLLGIALGVGTLIVVMSVMNGFRAELLGRILGINGHVNVVGLSGPLVDFDGVAMRVRKLPGVLSATPLVEGQVMAQGPRAGTGALVRGMRPQDLQARQLIADKITSGNLAELGDPDTVIVGARLAQRLGLGVNERITLLSPQGQVTPFGMVPRVKSYRIVALFQIGMFEYDNNLVFLPLDEAQRYFNLGNGVSSVEVTIANPDIVEIYRPSIFSAAAAEVRLVDWKQANLSFFNALQVERTVMFMILTLIIIVAAFNIISSMIMLVRSKGRDIAILRTMGAPKGAITRIFFLTGSAIGVLGTIFGIALGLGFALNIESIRQ